MKKGLILIIVIIIISILWILLSLRNIDNIENNASEFLNDNGFIQQVKSKTEADIIYGGRIEYHTKYLNGNIYKVSIGEWKNDLVIVDYKCIDSTANKETINLN